MEKVHGVIAWYQQKIGSYDKQLWEQSVEQKVLKGIQQAPRRSVRPKTDLIDVDLVRGSTFTKAKPQVPWTYITIKTFSRVVLYPFHYKWWVQQTSFTFWLILMSLYTMQIFTIIVFFNNVGDEIMQDEQLLSEVAIPCVLMVLLGLIHSQTVLTHLKPPIRDNKRDAWRRKRSLSQNRGSSSTAESPMAGSPSTQNTAESQGPSQSRSSLKGQVGSRPPRERTKERKVRLKSGIQRQTNWRGNVNDRDSESAYHTHEASDSIPDRTSSQEHDSNDRVVKGENNGKEHIVEVRRLDNDHGSTYVKGKDCDSVKRNLGDKHAHKSVESQESDLPDSNSEDEKSLKANGLVDDSVKRHSQSISSEEDECVQNIGQQVPNSSETKEALDDVRVEKHEVVDINIQLEERSQVNGFQNESKDKQNLAKKIKKGNGIKVVADSLQVSLPLIGNGNASVSDSSFVDVSLEEIVKPVDGANGVSKNMLNSGHLKSSIEEDLISVSTCQSDAQAKNHLDKTPAEVHATVHFTKDLDKAREVTPVCSRESTPTHTQSDVLLQSKHIRGSNLQSKTDTESESDREICSTKTLINVRRRKVTYSDTTEGNGTTLRNRRAPTHATLNFRENQKNRTGVSSSEGETEGQSSEYSRGSRRTMASSEEWGDHLQSDVDTSSETTSCGSEPEICNQEEPPPETESDTGLGVNHGMTASNMHVINLLNPQRRQSTTGQFSSHGPPDKVTCIIWERNECKKVELTAMDIGWAIIETVDKIPESSDYILIGLTFSVMMGLCPLLFQTFHSKDIPSILSWDCMGLVWDLMKKNTWRLNLIHLNAAIQRLCLSAIFFFMLSVADRTFKQRLLYAKHFCYLTSSRRARKFDMPHFRLNKVRNIRTWLSLRSYLKKRGPQRSVDVIVSAAFLLTLIILVLMCLQLLRDTEIYLNYLCNWELLVWCMALGVYLLRFMTLGLRINKKYRNLSVLITEQINLYLQMEQKPHKKEELMVANNVLKLAESLLKELESPFKISGISANPFILNFTKVVVLSAFSAVLTELLGFKLKLYKIKLKA